jgi:mono/diheme cytochrome c family protein
MSRTFFGVGLSVVAALAVGCKESPTPGGDVGNTDLNNSGTGGSGMCTNSPVSGGTAGGGIGIGGIGRFQPQVGTTTTQAVAPPAISGGTLRVLRDGVTAVAADPDRDQVYIVNLPSQTLTSTVSLQAGDEPGRVVEDGAGNVEVALRHGGALVTIAPSTGTVTARRDVCPAPRGVAYDAGEDVVHVACAGGELVTLPAGDGAPIRVLKLDHDLRDVVVDGNRLHVTRFRSAELITVEADGTVSDQLTLPGFRSQLTRGGQLFTASVAWKAMEAPAGGTVVLHQRGVDDPIQPAAGGYGGFDPCNVIVQTAVSTVGSDGSVKSGPSLAGMVVAVDMAISPDGNHVAIVSAGNSTNTDAFSGTGSLPGLFVTDMGSATDNMVGCRNDGQHGPCIPGSGVGITSPPPPGAAATPAATTCAPDGSATSDPSLPTVVGQPIAVAYMPSGQVIVQSREPAQLLLPGTARITLSTQSRADTGHTLFHANSGSFIACASCHAEGTEDGRTWKFSTPCEGATPRRTQSLQTGLRGTEPFHWAGDEQDFSHLMQDVFVGRMAGPQLTSDQGNTILSWLDAQPRLVSSPPADTAAVDRGRALFNDSTRAACATCHAGPSMTNAQTVDVGTGGKFQVPSLVGVGHRGPYMHNGCAATLRDRFGDCGGGDKHGVTSILSESEITDLVTYLQSL